MHYVAWRIGEGAVPYRDLFDMNFPGVYLLHLLVIRTLGAGDLAWRVFDLAWLAGTAGLIAALGRPGGRPAAGAGALVFALYHLAGGAWQAGQRDFLLCPLLLAGALGAARWVESRGRVALMWSGLALGASVMVKPHAALLAAALGTMVAAAAWRAGGGVAAPLGWFVAGAAVAPFAVVGWLALAGALPAWRAIVVDYLIPLYGRLGRATEWSVHRGWIWIPLGTGVLLSAGAALAAGRFGARHVAAGLGVLYGVLHFVGQGKGWEYHLYPLAAFAAALLVVGLAPALALPRRPAAAVLLLSAALAVVLLAEKAAAVGGADWERAKAARVGQLAAELALRLREGDTVQVFDTTAGGIHALLRLGVREPTRFLYDFHFFHDPGHPTVQALRAELLHGLDARPPALIVVFEEGWPAGGWERLDTFPGLGERLARYDLVHAGPGYRIHAQRRRP
ncbi:MAG TPA: hypothetical protein VFV05_04880 [Methylomirabilota bacterium]|nr:hypothetical protein [Methylomirabilota bacterium]